MKTLQDARLEFTPQKPPILQTLNKIAISSTSTSKKLSADIQRHFPLTFSQPFLQMRMGEAKRGVKPLKIGVVFSGGPGAGGHNVLAGLLDALLALNPKSSLLGFLHGPSGILESKTLSITHDVLAPYRNQGGFDLLGSGRTKIETQEQLAAALKTVQNLQLDGLVIVGGDDSNTNASILAEYFLKEKCSTCVVGVPKTIDGDLKNEHVAISFGFDTACKIYAEMIGNIARDALSTKKYTHFIKLMGRSASHIALECALKTQPNLTLIGEELGQKQTSLQAVVEEIASLIHVRAERGKNFSVILIPEGLIEYIPEVKALIEDLNHVLASTQAVHEENVLSQLKAESKHVYQLLPEKIRAQLLTERDPHGNVQVSLIETEKLLIELTARELAKRKKEGSYKGSFHPIAHFFGYEGRCGLPSNFDCNYCYCLGQTAALLLDEGATGYMAAIQNLQESPSEWSLAGVPIANLLYFEKRAGKVKPVIQKALVDLKGKHFQFFDTMRGRWAQEDDYLYPGPMQFFGDPALCDSVPITLK